MGFFSGLQNAFNPDRVAMTQALVAGDYGAAASIRARQSAAAAARAEAEQEAQIRADQIWGAKESGYSNPNIATMSPADLSTLQRSRLDPYSQAPGTRRVTPSINGGADAVNTAPINEEQIIALLRREDPSGELARSYLARQALIMQQGVDEQGRPITTAINPGALFNGPIGGVPPSPAQPPATPGGPPPTAPRVGGFSPRQMQQESGGRQMGPNGRTLVGRYRNGSMPAPAQRSYGAGQMQIGTARETAQRMGIPFDENRFMNDREYNLSLANAHMQHLTQRYGGDQELAQAAYHSGPRNVDNAVRQYGRENFTRGLGPHGRDYVRRVGTPQRSGRGGNIPRVSSAAQLSALPSGAEYIAPDGSVRRKR